MKTIPINLTVDEIELAIEALKSHADRLEAYGRARPQSAGPNDRLAERMHKLRFRLALERDCR